MARPRTSGSFDQRAAVFKALGEPTRLRIVDFLQRREGEATGTEVAEHAGISLALLCHHVDALIESGIVRKRKVGQTSYWTLDRTVLAAAFQTLRHSTHASLES
jgi:DNA-binding transcriptional ArsR family regulator